MKKRYTVGLDFGTLSARGVVLDLQTGDALAEDSLFVYPHGVFHTPGGVGGNPDFALADPDDYIAALEFLLCDLPRKNRISPAEIEGIGIDFTACTVLPVDADGVPLCRDPRFADNPHAYVKLWKHHGAKDLTDRIESVARAFGESFPDRTGGRVSCELMIPKLLETLEKAPEVYRATDRFMNAGDFLVRVLTGKEVHSTAFASIKEGWDPVIGFPKRAFFAALNPEMEDLIGTKLREKVDLAGSCGGRLSKAWAEKTGMDTDTAVAVPVVDAHAPMAVAGIGDGVLALVVGTSGCLCMNYSAAKPIPGVMSCGMNAVAEGKMTYDAGLSAAGDLFDWFVRRCVPGNYEREAAERGIGIHALLREKAIRKAPGESGLIALDWWNGNRSILGDSHLSGMILGLTLATPPEDIYRALIEATAYGVRRVYDNYAEQGVPVREVMVTGGIAEKDPMLMQIYADVLGCELKLLDSRQPTALGSAVFATVASGRYPDIGAASRALHGKTSVVYTPDPGRQAQYEALYREYLTLHDYFGCGGNDVMKRLSRKE